MKTVKQLQDAGFKVQPAKDAASCTEVVSSDPFWFYNPNFHQDRESIERGLSPATRDGDVFRLLAAGVFDGDDQFPFVLVSQKLKAQLAHANAQYREHTQAALEADKAYAEALRANLLAGSEVLN